MTPADRRLSGSSALSSTVEGHVLHASAEAGGTAGWVAGNRQRIMGVVAAEGWALVRGLEVRLAEEFRERVVELGLPVAHDYGDLPMSASEGGVPGVFGVTPFPSEDAILFHHEGAHTPRAPRYICFHCAIAAGEGGETPLADSARVLDALPEPIRKAFADKGLRYRRNYVEGLDVPWQRYFGTSDRRAVEALCAAQGIVARWREDGSLCTETFRPAVVRHPDTGRGVFFNQVLLHHPASLDPEIREALSLSLPEGGLPRDVCFGDGTPIPDEWAEEILQAHVRVARAFRWQPGDMLIVDNLAVAHARRPYRGERRHHVILSHSRPESDSCQL